MTTLASKDGNTITKEGSKVFINLTTEKRKRPIGELRTVAGRVNWYKDEKESQRFRKTDSWSVPYELLKFITGQIKFRTEKGIYTISIEAVHEHGSFLHFKTEGIERKLYVPVKHWSTEKLVN